MQIPNFNQLKLISLLAAVRISACPLLMLRWLPRLMLFKSTATQWLYTLDSHRTILQIMSLAYSTIAVGLSINNGRQPGVDYNLDGESVASGVFNAMTAFGTIAFAYGGHNVVLEIQVSKNCALCCQCSFTIGLAVAFER